MKGERRTAMQFSKHALILAVVEGLQQQGSWTGKTHVQKALFLLGASGVLEVPFPFVLYKHGPYSFDAEEELEQMKSYAALDCRTVEGYGVVLSPGSNAPLVKRLCPLPAAVQEAVDFVCLSVGRKKVAELEPLATAAWIRTRERLVEPAAVVERLRQLKPHVGPREAEEADREARRIFEAAASVAGA
jgi:hypothetical protein